MMKRISIFLFAAAALLGAGCDDSSDTDKVIPVSAIALDTSLSGGISLVVGQTADIAGKVTVRPENATDKTETYESSDPETVSVDDAGVVKAVKPGLAMVTISVGGKHSHFEVEVREQRISVESVTLPAELADGVTLKLGATLDIAGKATITPSNATDKTESYNSSNPMIASVTEEGIVSAIAIGEATITISVDGKSAQFTLTVEKIAVESVTLPDEWKDGYTMPLSGTLELAGKAAVLPENASNRAESYDSSDKEVATVSAKGVVTPLKAGKTTISITIDGVSASFELTVAADVPVDLEKIEIKNGATPIQGSASVALGANTTFDLYSQLQLTPANQTEGVKYVAYGPEEIATIDENGIVTCWKVGNPKITYTIGDASASLSLTVTEPTIKICYGDVEKTDISLSGQWGYEIQLTAAVTPEGSEVTWSSEDPAIATVSETGLVTGKKMGYTNIVCKSGTAKAVCIIRVADNPPAAAAAAPQATPDPNDKTPRVVITCFGLPNSDFTITVGQSVDLNCTMYNIDPSTNKETWTIEDTAIATVNENGVVTGVKAGTTKVICTVGDVKCETIVRVTDKKS